MRDTARIVILICFLCVVPISATHKASAQLRAWSKTFRGGPSRCRSRSGESGIDRKSSNCRHERIRSIYDRQPAARRLQRNIYAAWL